MRIAGPQTTVALFCLGNVLLAIATGCSGSSSRTPTTVAAAAASPATNVENHDNAPKPLRTQGTVAALRATSVLVPRISGQGGSITLTKLLPNGSIVKIGDLLAEFDNTPQLKSQRDAQAKYDDLSHQVDQKLAEGRSNAAKRAAEVAQALGDLEKARLELRKGPVLSDLEQAKNREKVTDAQAHLDSLSRSGKFREEAEKMEAEVLIRQRDRQKVTLARLQQDLDQLTVRATFDGMTALVNVWKNNSMGHAQEGDQLYPGSPLMKIFDPSSMTLELSVNEADGAVLQPGSTATVYLDAYPGLTFPAHFESASPVAASALGSPLKTFSARYLLDSNDPHLLPDLSAAADIQPASVAIRGAGK